jgi:hypothetical protein
MATQAEAIMRFAAFTKLTLHRAMPGTEQVPSRLQRMLRPRDDTSGQCHLLGWGALHETFGFTPT